MLPLTSQPLIRPVTWEEARSLSPWPDRIRGVTPWEKRKRSVDLILDEYDRGWYAEALEGWRQFLPKHAIGGHIPLAAVLEYYRYLHGVTCDGIAKNKDVYGHVDVTQFLVSSSGDQLCAFDFLAGSEVHYQMVARHLSRVMREVGATTVVELGCGNGINLVHVMASGAAHEAYGGEVGSNARTLLEEIARASSSALHAFPFDFRKSGSLHDLPLSNKPWVLTTLHAIEQVETGAGPLLEAILAAPNPPTRVVHLEPAHAPTSSGDESEIAKACRRYAAINGYNADLLDLLVDHERNGRLIIKDVRMRMFGLSAFNPTTLIEWQPKGR